MARKVKVLYLDDEEMNLFIFTRSFDSFDVVTAETAERALQVLRRDKGITKVISDVQMPGLTGLEFIIDARKLRPEVNYYLLSGYEISREIHEAVESGLVKRYFRKPMNVDEVERAMLGD